MKKVTILIPKTLYIPKKGIGNKLGVKFCPNTKDYELCGYMPCGDCVYEYFYEEDEK